MSLFLASCEGTDQLTTKRLSDIRTRGAPFKGTNASVRHIACC